jgi:hypothetical protein
MTLIIFKYCLPALLGYTLFAGIAGRLNPLMKPYQPEKRPSWLLGVWTGLTVSLVMGIGLHMAYGMSLEGAKALAKPSLWLMAGLLASGFIVYLIYRSNVKNLLDGQSKSSFDGALESEDLEFAGKFDPQGVEGHPLDRGLEPHILDGIRISNAENSATETSLASLETDLPVTEGLSEAVNESGSNTSLLPAEEPLDLESETETETMMFDAPPETPAENFAEEPATLGAEDFPSTLSDSPVNTALSEQVDTTPVVATEHDLVELQSLFLSEQALREETEKHLRITRKALATIESEARHFEIRKADAIIKLEEKLADNIKSQSALQARATREKTQRINVETTIVNLKQDLVKAKQEVRRGIAARAKALSTANKSIAFARQNVQIRARLESEINDMQDTLKNRQTTISSLIRALEKEKRRTQDDVAAMAKQLVLHEKQVNARRSLEEVAKSVEMKLSSRLVKKVANSRPLSSDS